MTIPSPRPNPGNYDMVFEQGATFAKSFQWTQDSVAVDLTGYGGLMQIRQRPGGTLIAELSTANGRFLVQPGGVTGRWDLIMSAEDTETLVPGRYDLLFINLTDPTDVVKFLAGRAIVQPMISVAP